MSSHKSDKILNASKSNESTESTYKSDDFTNVASLFSLHSDASKSNEITKDSISGENKYKIKKEISKLFHASAHEETGGFHIIDCT